MMYPSAYIQYLVHFHGDRDYFECHEILEEYWKGLPNENKQSIWVGFILLAVSNYHYRRQNTNGAERTLQKAITILRNQQKTPIQLGLDFPKLLLGLEKRLVDIQTNQHYHSINLPIIDEKLLNLCLSYTEAMGLAWGQDSNLRQMDIIDRHKLRDRSEVVKQRHQALNMKRTQKESREPN